MITPTEVHPADKFTAAVRDFHTPKSITDVRAWFGLVNQVSYAFSMTTAMSPFRHLLKPSTPFQWTDKLAEALHTSKLHICHNIEKGVQIFDKDRPTCLATDWHGLLVDSETLQVPLKGPILLPRRVAYHSCGIKVYSRCRVQICPRRGGGPGRGRCPRQSLTLHPRVQQPHSSSGPQTTENLWGSDIPNP